MYSYRAYGLTIHSPFQLPEFVAHNGEADVIIRFASVEPPWTETNEATRRICGTAEAVYLYWKDIGVFHAQRGKEISIDPLPEAEERAIRLAIIGPVLGVLLHQRGLAVFHGSAVALPFGAVAFMARPRHGKSTMAATLHMRGHELIADDVVALETREDHYMIRPGFPQMKLWPETVTAIGQTPESLPKLREKLEKRAHRVTGGFSTQPLPLRCIYLLASGPDLEIVPLSSKEAWKHVMFHWYGALFRGELLKIFGLDNHLRECTDLVKKVPVFILRRPNSLTALPDVARLVEEHVDCDL